MITGSISGSAFEQKTGRPWTAGLSLYQDSKALNINWQKAGSLGGRWFFEIDGVQYSAKSLSPNLKDIQMHIEEPSDHDDGQYDYGCP